MFCKNLCKTNVVTILGEKRNIKYKRQTNIIDLQKNKIKTSLSFYFDNLKGLNKKERLILK